MASAGTTDTGAVDPLLGMARFAEREQLWFHVDAAYGGAFLLLDEMRPRLAGIERADSVVIDPHKGLFLPYGSGAVLVRDPAHLQARATACVAPTCRTRPTRSTSPRPRTCPPS